jgi:hypothetical protein
MPPARRILNRVDKQQGRGSISASLAGRDPDTRVAISLGFLPAFFSGRAPDDSLLDTVVR